MKSYSVLLAAAVTASARTFTVTNACAYTVWPGVFTTPIAGKTVSVPDVETGWEAPPGSTRSFNVPNDWTSGRIWGRRDCDFSTSLPGSTQCLIGACNGGLLCDPQTGTGVPPATLAEWTLSGGQNLDYYDVSLVDGAGVPMAITNDAKCPVASCAVELGPNCPAALAGPTEANGTVLGCKSACLANVDGNQANSPNCCSGSFNVPATCPPSGVAFYSYFKNACPDSYVYAYDESSGTALFNCDASTEPNYTLTFCPGTSNAPPPAASAAPPPPTSSAAPPPPAPSSNSTSAAPARCNPSQKRRELLLA